MSMALPASCASWSGPRTYKWQAFPATAATADPGRAGCALGECARSWSRDFVSRRALWSRFQAAQQLEYDLLEHFRRQPAGGSVVARHVIAVGQQEPVRKFVDRAVAEA